MSAQVCAASAVTGAPVMSTGVRQRAHPGGLGGAFRHGDLPEHHGVLTGRAVGHRREQHWPAVVPGSAQVFAVQRDRPAVGIAGGVRARPGTRRRPRHRHRPVPHPARVPWVPGARRHLRQAGLVRVGGTGDRTIAGLMEVFSVGRATVYRSSDVPGPPSEPGHGRAGVTGQVLT